MASSPPAPASAPASAPARASDSDDYSTARTSQALTDQSTSTAPSSTHDQADATTAEFQGDVDVSNDVPTQEELASVADLVVLAADGRSRPFKSLYAGDGVAKRMVVIFVRHFFCGNCQEYLRAVSQSITPDALLSLPTPTFITVIGCGSPELIPMYVEATGCPFSVYADPSRRLFDLLGMTRTLSLGPKRPTYMRKSLFSNGISSIIQGIRSGRGAVKGGDVKQVGGEFLFEDEKVVWCHRMRNTRDHAEVEELKRIVGLEPGHDATGMETQKKRRSTMRPDTLLKRRSGNWSKTFYWKSDETEAGKERPGVLRRRTTMGPSVKAQVV